MTMTMTMRTLHTRTNLRNITIGFKGTETGIPGGFIIAREIARHRKEHTIEGEAFKEVQDENKDN